MRAKQEAEVLDPIFRAAVLKEITGSTESKLRKDEHTRRREVYRDRVKEYVLRLLRIEMGKDTASEMQHRTPNLNITRKIVDKKARVYKDRPMREAENTAEQEKLDGAVNVLRLDSVMKQVNAAVELHLNILVSVLPFFDRRSGKWDAQAQILDPSRFDVIEDEENPRSPLAVITSYFNDAQTFLSDYRTGDASPEVIAAASASTGKESEQRFIWWTDTYHFTTDAKGVIVSDQGKQNLNPLGAMPYISFAKNQGDGFWADGGEGVVDNAILFNMMMADMNYSAKYQSIGIGYIKGKGSLSSVTTGPSRFVKMEYEEGDPVPEIGFANPNPALAENMAILEQFLSLFLTSEGLEPGAITGQLDAGKAASGVQEIIQRSEPTAMIEDEQQLYKDTEPQVVQALARVVAAYPNSALLCDDLRELVGMATDFDYELSFRAPAPFVSEKERLEIAKLKKDSGFYTDDELLEYMFPDLDADARAEKLLTLKPAKVEEKLIEKAVEKA
jgi:hypothetical protein